MSCGAVQGMLSEFVVVQIVWLPNAVLLYLTQTRVISRTWTPWKRAGPVGVTYWLGKPTPCNMKHASWTSVRLSPRLSSAVWGDCKGKGWSRPSSSLVCALRLPDLKRVRLPAPPGVSLMLRDWMTDMDELRKREKRLERLKNLREMLRKEELAAEQAKGCGMGQHTHIIACCDSMQRRCKCTAQQ